MRTSTTPGVARGRCGPKLRDGMGVVRAVTARQAHNWHEPRKAPATTAPRRAPRVRARPHITCTLERHLGVGEGSLTRWQRYRGGRGPHGGARADWWRPARTRGAIRGHEASVVRASSITMNMWYGFRPPAPSDGSGGGREQLVSESRGGGGCGGSCGPLGSRLLFDARARRGRAPRASPSRQRTCTETEGGTGRPVRGARTGASGAAAHALRPTGSAVTAVAAVVVVVAAAHARVKRRHAQETGASMARSQEVLGAAGLALLAVAVAVAVARVVATAGRRGRGRANRDGRGGRSRGHDGRSRGRGGRSRGRGRRAGRSHRRSSGGRSRGGRRSDRSRCGGRRHAASPGSVC